MLSLCERTPEVKNNVLWLIDARKIYSTLCIFNLNEKKPKFIFYGKVKRENFNISGSGAQVCFYDNQHKTTKNIVVLSIFVAFLCRVFLREVVENTLFSFNLWSIFLSLWCFLFPIFQLIY